MYYVYILKSKSNPDKYYVGYTNNIKRRILQHNEAPTSNHTSIYGPWELLRYIAFTESKKARKFEKYLKTPSGKAFLNKRLV